MNEKLPSSLEAERMVLGGIVLDTKIFAEIAGVLQAEDFSTDAHRIIFRRMKEIVELGEPVDRITLAQELIRYNELEKVGGLSYLVDLDTGMPRVPNLLSYARIVKEKSSLRKLIFASNKIMNRAMLDQESSMQIASESVEMIHGLGITSGGENNHDASGLITGTPGAEAMLTPGTGIPTGFAGIDRLTHGLLKGGLYLIGADTTVGKSSLSVNIARNVAASGTPVLYFTLEMDQEDLIRRILSAEAQVPLDRIYRRELTKNDRAILMTAATKVSQYPLYINQTPSTSILDFGREVERMVRQKKIGLAIIDYIQIMDWQSGKNGLPKFNREFEALAYMTRHFKEYARQFQIPIIMVSQLSRQRQMRSSKDLRPKLCDLHGSSTLEKDSDVVMLLYREEMDLPLRPELKGDAELLIRKNRGGMQGTIYLKFRGEFCKFYEPGSEPLREQGAAA